MVRMAQGVALRYPLVDGQGNFGSRDGASGIAVGLASEIRSHNLREVAAGVDAAAGWGGAQAAPPDECEANCAQHRPVRLSWAKLPNRDRSGDPATRAAGIS